MITGVFGLPRSGKSTYLAKIAKKAIKKGTKVYSNYYIKGCYKLDFFDLGVHDYSDCLILIDEISLVADCRQWKNFNSNLVYFFTNHGHYNVDIVYCSQDYKDCDSKIRNLTQNLYYVKSFPFGFSLVRNISRTITIDSDIATVYQLSGFPRFVFRPFYYSLFDSFVRRSFLPNTAELW